MNRINAKFFPGFLCLFCCMTALLPGAHAADSLKSINNPGGGQILYGPFGGESTLRGAMGAMLRDVHTRFGDRPQIGKLFRTPQQDSIAAFFTLTAKNQGGKRITDMVIVTMPLGSKPAAAVLFDDSSRFNHTANAMMKKLNEAWHTEAANSAPRQTSGVVSKESTSLPLHQAVFADKSGSIGLASGWQIANSGGGAVHVAGPHGEQIYLGAMFQNIYDTRYPQARGLINYMNMSHKPYFVCPYGGDLLQSWQAILKQGHQRDGTPVPTFTATSVQEQQPNTYESQVELLQGEFDANDGTGPMFSSVRLGAIRMTGNGGMWALAVSRSSVPKKLADEEWPTVVAMVRSYRQNGAEIQRQTNIVIENIHANAAAAKARADATSAANDAHNRGVEAQWDDNARYNKSFENYQLDQTIIQDNENNTRSPVDNNFADSLVRNAPNRFQYVPQQDFLKGVDY